MSAGAGPEGAPTATRVMVVDDEAPLRLAARHLLEAEGFEVSEAERGEEALTRLDSVAPHVVVTDLRMPGMSGLELLRTIRSRRPEVEVILVTAHGSVETAVEALRDGAYHFLLKPIDPVDMLVQTVRRAAERHRMARRIEALEEPEGAAFGEMIGASPAMQQVYKLVDSVATNEAPVLVLGESGTGKELVARTLHRRSARAKRKFVAVNCAALQETLLESELFGYARGAFSGAVSDKPGLMEEADKGTLFLDEIGEMSPALQAKLLRALEDGEIRRVGELKTRHVDVRLISATNLDLAARVREGKFREDLYYRLNVFCVRMPPLRERGADIVMLARMLLRRYSGGSQLSFDAAALDALSRHRWPGNVRELQNAVRYAAAVAQSEVVAMDDLPETVRPDTEESAPTPYRDLLESPYGEARASFISQFERLYVRHRMEQAGGSLTKAAKLAGMDRANFRRLAKRAGVSGGQSGGE